MTTWDTLSSEHQVDVFQAVHNVKRNRPQLVCDMVDVDLSSLMSRRYTDTQVSK